MAKCCWIICFFVFSSLVRVYEASPNPGDSDQLYKACFSQCQKTGCVGAKCFSCCNSASDGSLLDGSWYKIKNLYFWWNQWDCQGNCRYHCMLYREKERIELGLEPVKYHGKWPSRCQYGFQFAQEPISVAISALNLVMHFHGWRSFSNLLYYSLPLKPDKTPFYDYASLFKVYGLLAMNSWFWSAIYHFRDMALTEKLEYSSVVAFLGYSIILANIRSFGLRSDAARVMVAAPIFAFATTHILFLCNYNMDYEWNTKVCIGMGIAQAVSWAVWGGTTDLACRWKLWMVVLGGAFGVVGKMLDFPPYQGIVHGETVWQASNIPLTYIWWNFIKYDAESRTADLLKKVR
ncbi:post-GPI attachment to proteins factor 3-like isoform X1 [Salvia splendens]|nr:post-GPI attachment to proteins factor 3-like isoform X1 [Salvia splendens]